MKPANRNLLTICWCLLVVPLLLCNLVVLFTPTTILVHAISIYDKGMFFIYPGFLVSVVVGYLRKNPGSWTTYKQRARYVSYSLLHQIINVGIAIVGVDILFDMLRSMSGSPFEYAVVVITSAAVKITTVLIFGAANVHLVDEWREYRVKAARENQRKEVIA